nr:hypothetical protein CTI12_AA376470 [Tanacetum cinerariifolium]
MYLRSDIECYFGKNVLVNVKEQDFRILSKSVEMVKSVEIKVKNLGKHCMNTPVWAIRVVRDLGFGCDLGHHSSFRHCRGVIEIGEEVDQTIVASLIVMFDESSAVAKAFRMARDWCHSHDSAIFELRLLSDRSASREDGFHEKIPYHSNTGIFSWKPSSSYGNNNGYCSAMYDTCNSEILLGPACLLSITISLEGIPSPKSLVIRAATSDMIGVLYYLDALLLLSRHSSKLTESCE